jgi:hypothetical protein
MMIGKAALLKNRLMGAPATERAGNCWTSGTRLPVVGWRTRKSVWSDFLWNS